MKTSVIDLDEYFDKLDDTESVSFKKCVTDNDDELLAQLGFTLPMRVNETIIPNPTFNKFTKINYRGKTVIRKDLPKDDVYYQSVTYQAKDEYGCLRTYTKEVARVRYRREQVEPYKETLCMSRGLDGKMYIRSKPLKKTDRQSAKFVRDLFHSIFGDYDIENDKEAPKVRTLNFVIINPSDNEQNRTGMDIL